MTAQKVQQEMATVAPVTATDELVDNPYLPEAARDPDPVMRRRRAEAPRHYNAEFVQYGADLRRWDRRPVVLR